MPLREKVSSLLQLWLDEISEELNKSLESVPEPKTKEEKQAVRTKKKQLKS